MLHLFDRGCTMPVSQAQLVEMGTAWWPSLREVYMQVGGGKGVWGGGVRADRGGDNGGTIEAEPLDSFCWSCTPYFDSLSHACTGIA